MSGIQYLRGLAALMIACLHALAQVPAHAPLLQQSGLGRLNLAGGLDVFFVISGFIMVHADHDRGPLEFMRRRLIRIVPLYWLLTLLLASIAVAQPAWVRGSVVSWRYLAESLLFIPYANPAQGGLYFPLLVPGWSLEIEMFFYIAFALLLCAPEAARTMLAGIGFLFMATLPELLPGIAWRPELLFFSTPSLFEFWVGMVIARTVRADRMRWVSPSLALALILAGGTILLTAPVFPPGVRRGLDVIFFATLPAGAVVLGTVMLDRSGRLQSLPWLHWLGDASYSMYLSHVFALALARHLWTRLGLDAADAMHAGGFLLFAMGGAVAVTWGCHAGLEKPLGRLFSAFRMPKPDAIPADGYQQFARPLRRKAGR